MANEFEPIVLAFCCNWCAYAGADLAGTSRAQYAPNLRVIRVMCSGMVHPNLVVEALTKGADGVLVLGCHPGDCHYLEGNRRAEDRREAISLLLEDLRARARALPPGMGLGVGGPALRAGGERDGGDHPAARARPVQHADLSSTSDGGREG